MKTKKQPAQTHLFNDPDSAGSSALPATLRDDLRTLGLVYMEAHAAHAAQEAARSGTAHLAYLEALAAGESAAQHDRTVARRLAAARFPVLKTMAGWNWSWPKKINRMQVEHLLQLGFLQTCANVILLGPTGVGKTHLACALGHAACLQRHPVLYASAIDVVNRLSAAHSAHQLASEIKRYQAPRLLILDELGYNVEHLFQRLNGAGTELRGEELTFSMIKAYWPSIELSFDAIQDKAGNHYLPMAGSRLATLGARAALIGFGQNAGKENLPAPLSISRIRSLANAPTAKAEKERLQKYLGIEVENIQESDLHENLRQIDEWLLFTNSVDSDYGLPPILRASLAHDAPDLFLLLLHLAQKARHDQLSKDEIEALRKPILGLATALCWFGDDRAKAVGSLYSSHFSSGSLSPDSFSGVLKHCLQPPVGKRELFKLLSPIEFDSFIPELRASDENLEKWNFWERIVLVETDATKRAILAGC